MIQDIIKESGRIDVLIINAGAALLDAIEGILLLLWRRRRQRLFADGLFVDRNELLTVFFFISFFRRRGSHQQMETNFFRPLRLCRALISSKRESRSGTIVSVSSGTVFIGRPTRGLCFFKACS